MQNNSNKIVIALLVVAVLVLGYLAFFKNKETNDDVVVPQGQTQTNQNPNGLDYQPNSSTSTTTPVPCDTMGCQSGMQDGGETGVATITKPDWGVSFTKPAGWRGIIYSIEVSLKESTEGDTMTIQYISGNTITDNDAKFGPITYYYDGNRQRWMKSAPDESAVDPNALVTTVAIADTYTKDGLPVFRGTGRWLTYIVPLSHTTFLKLNISGGGYTQPLTDLVATIKKI